MHWKLENKRLLITYELGWREGLLPALKNNKKITVGKGCACHCDDGKCMQTHKQSKDAN